MYKLSVLSNFEQDLQKVCPEKSVRLYDLYVRVCGDVIWIWVNTLYPQDSTYFYTCIFQTFFKAVYVKVLK